MEFSVSGRAHQRTEVAVTWKCGGRVEHAAHLAREDDQEVVPALRAPRAGEAMGEDAAFERAEVALDVTGDHVGVIAFAMSQREPNLEVNLDRAIHQRVRARRSALRAAHR